jgi:hypothetical protein
MSLRRVLQPQLWTVFTVSSKWPEYVAGEGRGESAGAEAENATDRALLSTYFGDGTKFGVEELICMTALLLRDSVCPDWRP